MQLVFTKHAKSRMRERKIGKAEVLNTLLSPDKFFMQGTRSVSIKYRKNKQLLIVYFMYKINKAVIITVISTSKHSKYL